MDESIFSLMVSLIWRTGGPAVGYGGLVVKGQLKRALLLDLGRECVFASTAPFQPGPAVGAVAEPLGHAELS